MLLDGLDARPDSGDVAEPELVIMHGGKGLLYIVIDDGTERVVYLNVDAPRLIDACDIFEPRL